VLPLLVLPLYALIGLLTWTSRDTRPELYEMTLAFEIILPLGVGLAAAHLMSLEREEGFDALRRSYPEAFWQVPLLRLVGAVVFAAISVLITIGLFLAAYGPFDLGSVVLPALAPGLYLLGMALLVNNLSGNYWASAGVVLAYWFIELQWNGAVTGSLYLFNESLPRPGVDPLLNRWLLVVVGGGMLLANVAYSAWRRRRAGG
jgi:ABC-type transport system involved in multi-copper enzyme maturation permease subunit